MATFTWETWSGAGPAWTDIAGNTVVFSGSGGLATPITVAAFQDETHVGNGDPGTDQCGANHPNNVKWISSTEYDDGGGTETLNDTNLTIDEHTLRVRFTDGSSVAITNARFYAYDASVTTNEAVGVVVYAHQGEETQTGWNLINNDTGNTGGDNVGERLDLQDQGAATNHTYYISITASPESVGAKTSFDFGIALTYS